MNISWCEVDVNVSVIITIVRTCSCHLNNHPSILWTILYPSPDDGYYNRNVNVDFTSWYIHLFGLYFFLLPSYIYIYIYYYLSFMNINLQVDSEFLNHKSSFQNRCHMNSTILSKYTWELKASINKKTCWI